MTQLNHNERMAVQKAVYNNLAEVLGECSSVQLSNGLLKSPLSACPLAQIAGPLAQISHFQTLCVISIASKEEP